MEAQELEIGRAAKRNMSAREVDGDTVWVMFPNLAKGKRGNWHSGRMGRMCSKDGCTMEGELRFWDIESEPMALGSHGAEEGCARQAEKAVEPNQNSWRRQRIKEGEKAAVRAAKEAEKALKGVEDEVAEELRRELDDKEMDFEKIVAKAFGGRRRHGRLAVPSEICGLRPEGR